MYFWNNIVFSKPRPFGRLGTSEEASNTESRNPNKIRKYTFNEHRRCGESQIVLLSGSARSTVAAVVKQKIKT